MTMKSLCRGLCATWLAAVMIALVAVPATRLSKPRPLPGPFSVLCSTPPGPRFLMPRLP